MSCNSTLNITAGRYNENDGKGIFMIYPNNTFTYSSGEIPEKYSNGSWMQYENRIFINSTVQSKKIAVNVEVVPENQKNIQFFVKLDVPDHDISDYSFYPVYNNKIQQIIQPIDTGIYSFYPEVNIDSIHFIIKKEPKTLKELENNQPKFYEIESEIKSLVSIDGDRVNINLQVPDSLFTYRLFTNTSLKFKKRSIYFTDPEKGNVAIKYRLKDHKKSIIKSIKKKNLHSNMVD